VNRNTRARISNLKTGAFGVFSVTRVYIYRNLRYQVLSPQTAERSKNLSPYFNRVFAKSAKRL
jgi:hypothetical protein